MQAEIKTKVRRYLRAQQTILNWLGADTVKPMGFYIPYRYASGVHTPSSKRAVPWLLKKLKAQEAQFLALLKEAQEFNSRLKEFRIGSAENVNQPRFNQDWFPGVDGAMAYCMVRKFKPKRIIEIGSGHSTRWMAQAIVDGELSTNLHSIDPEPRREIDAICSKITRNTVEGVKPAVFEKLAAGDILFVDCSHIAMPGSDVDYLFTNIFPLLAKGVVIHVHDIFLPYGYPESWEWRSYNEQNFLLAMLSGGDRYKVLFPNAYARRNLAKATAKLYAPKKQGAFEGSFWMQVQ